MRSALLSALLLSTLARAAEPEPSPLHFTASLDDGLKVESTDGNYGVQLGALMWGRFDAAVAGTVVKDQFLVPLMRPALRAHFVRPWINVFAQAELAGTPKLLDLELDVHPIPEIGLKLGQLVTPFSRAYLTPIPKLQFGGFTVANDVFRMNRDTGVLAYGTALNNRLEYFAGVFNGNGIDVATNDNPQLMYAGRLAGTLFGTAPNPKAHVRYDETAALTRAAPATLMVGIDGYVDRLSTTGQADQLKRAASVDAAFLYRRLFVQAEGYLQGVELVGSPTQTRFGADAQVGFFVWPSTLELAGRFSWVRLDASDASAWLVQGEGQLGWYVAGNHLKAIARYVLTDAGSAQRGYTAGITHGLFVQLQAWL